MLRSFLLRLALLTPTYSDDSYCDNKKKNDIQAYAILISFFLHRVLVPAVMMTILIIFKHT